jgi:FlaA1/EpsC-like NDP-sugar epimerase
MMSDLAEQKQSTAPESPWLERMRTAAGEMPRAAKRLVMIAFDFVALILIIWIILSLRFNRLFVPNLDQALVMLAAPLIAIPIFIRLGLYRSVLRYLPDRAIWTVAQAMTIATLVWVTLAFMTSVTGLEGIPRSIPIAYWAVGIGVIVASRFGAKRFLWGRPRAHLLLNQTLIYGTGDAATQLASALRSTNERLVSGFITDDPTLHGMDIMGIRVYPPQDIPTLVANFGVNEIIIAAAASAARQRDLLAAVGSSSVKVRILPPIADLAAGKHVVGSLRHIDIEDLLGRSEVPANPALLRDPIEGQVIMITGAAGSIGSALTRTVARLNPSKLILLEFNEFGLYQIGREIRRTAKFPVISVLGSIGDEGLVDRAIKDHGVKTIYHCAAYKHVGLV